LRVPIYRDVAMLSPTEIAERVPKNSEASRDLQSQVKGGNKPRHYVFVGAGLVPALNIRRKMWEGGNRGL